MLAPSEARVRQVSRAQRATRAHAPERDPEVGVRGSQTSNVVPNKQTNKLQTPPHQQQQKMSGSVDNGNNGSSKKFGFLGSGMMAQALVKGLGAAAASRWAPARGRLELVSGKKTRVLRAHVFMCVAAADPRRLRCGGCGGSYERVDVGHVSGLP